MGEIADMMLDGTLCEGCGVYLDGGDGFPQRCASCRRGEPSAARTLSLPKPKVKCGTCGKRVSPDGLKDHKRAKHPVAVSGEVSGG